MNKIIAFEKEIIFKTNIAEITSISLEHQLDLEKSKVLGEFIISGEYKITDSSLTVEPFEYKLPFEINIDSRYNTEQAIVDIDDFYYEIINNSVLKISIDVKIDKLKEIDESKMIMEDNIMDKSLDREVEVKEDSIIEESVESLEEQPQLNNETVSQSINNVFNGISNQDNYVSYNIYIVREDDNLDKILDKYNVTEEELKKYNDLSHIEIGDKIVIPD